MRIYNTTHELMSETGRNLLEMGIDVYPKTYQNKVIQGDPQFHTKELMCEQYCLLNMDDPDPLFVFSKDKDWADAEFQERINPMPVNPGEAYKLRPEVWEQFLVKDYSGKMVMDYTYSERFRKAIVGNYRADGPRRVSTDPLYEVISLLKRDTDTRKAILPIFTSGDVAYLDGSKRIPCSMYYNFLIRPDARGEKRLNICYHQRSSDFVTHFGNDVYLAWRMMEYVASMVGVKPGNLIHTIDSLHVYSKDMEQLRGYFL